MITENFQQGTQEWHQARCGIPTASSFSKIVTSQGKRSASAQDYMNKLAGESVVGTQESFKSAHMERGNELEPQARSFYSFVADVDVTEVGLCYMDESKAFSCSPDGLVGEDGGLEIKCPALNTHVDYLRLDKCPAKYVPQVQGSMYITGRKWWDFMSYFPGMKPLIVRVERDDEFIGFLAAELAEFLEKLNKLKEMVK